LAVSPVETEQTKEQPQLNENNLSTAAQYLNNTNSQPLMTSTVQQPYSSPSTSSISYFPPQINTIQNSSIPMQLLNSQNIPQQLGTSSEKPFLLMPQVTNLSTSTTQESTTITTPQELIVTSVCPLQSGTTQESTYQSSVIPAQNSHSQYFPTNVGATTSTTDIHNSKEISNYFTQFQTQASLSNNSSTIPMFSVKNFPQVSPLAQPLGKLLNILYLHIIVILLNNYIILRMVHWPFWPWIIYTQYFIMFF